MRDLSEAATDEAELEGCEISFLGLDFARVEWFREILAEAEVVESCDVDRSRDAFDSGESIFLSS